MLGSSARQIVLTSATGGIAGSLYVHFPIATPPNPDRVYAAHGQVVFSNDREQLIPAGPRLSFIEPYDLQLSQFSGLFAVSRDDTLTHAQGSVYPDSVSAVLGPPHARLAERYAGQSVE